MLYPKNISDKLGLDQVLAETKERCETLSGRQMVDRVRFSADREQINLWLSQTEEMRSILENAELNVSLVIDFDLKYKVAGAAGFFYETEDIQHIQDCLYAMHKVESFAVAHETKYIQMHKLFSDLEIDWNLTADINKVIGPDGAVKSNASPALQKIENAIISAQKSIIKSSASIFNIIKDKGFLGDTELGIKNGRVVLPVLSEYKNKVSGVLIDQSNTGKISYIEPLELVSINNQLSEYNIQKRLEIIRVLRELTAKIVVQLRFIKRGIQRMEFFDFVRAKARLALDWRCVMPKLGSHTEVYESKHPLLNERLKGEGKQIVALNYSLTEEQKLIVISGPNAGGKSVALKTVGILQYMLQTGFLVPCLSTSTFSIFTHMFVDIGDNQSIESDLSTYSSHLKAAKHIINFSNDETLVLMDEIGTGTDPMFGGPMAEAVLEEINRKGAYGIITTHFSNIKSKAKKLKKTANAAMLFDVDKLEPLYKLQIGQPGSSFVYEVASNIGLNKKLIKRAKQLTDTKQYDLDVLLAEVQTQQERLKIEQEELNRKSAQANLVENEYRKLRDELYQQRNEIILQSKEQAKSILKDANKEIERTIREIKETKAHKKKTQEVRKELAEKIEANEPVEVSKPIVSNLKVGDTVQLLNTGTTGEIVEIKRDKATLSVGGLITKTNLVNLEKVGKKTAKKIKKYISESSYVDKQTSFKSEKDIRGMRTYDALAEIDTWVDSAIILGVNKLRVLHGKGNGILKAEIRRHLKGNPAIANIAYERVDLGGEGISIIELK